MELNTGEILGYGISPNGFKDFESALSTIDWDDPPFGSFWKIQGQVYQMVAGVDAPRFVEYD